MPHPLLILASASPRRLALLEGLGLSLEVLAPAVDESATPGETAPDHVRRLAAAKSDAALARLRAEGRAPLVLTADTTVTIDGLLLGKPANEAEAQAMILRLAGRSHEVWTACRLARADDGRSATRLSRTVVRFAPWDPVLARWYVATGEPMDKAGGYALQGRGALLVSGIEGSWSNVVGLPLEELPALFEAVGDDLRRRLVEGSAGGC